MQSNITTIIDDTPLLAERFRVIRPLGEGSAGVVYHVADLKRNSQEVALKILTNKDAFDEHTLRRFEEEIKVMQRLRHPNLIQAYDLITLEDTIAFSMELVKGLDLGKLYSKLKLEPQEIDRIFKQLLLALHELHSNGIVHRDIKLENVLICDDGTVKLSDLGLMKKSDLKDLTRTGVLLGTAQYMPPEYITESKFDNRGDLYACGIMLYEMLSGKRRLAELKGMEAIEYLIRNRFELPKLPLHGAAQKYMRIIERATQKNVKKRYQTALEMAEDFCPELKKVKPASGIAIKPSVQVFDFCEAEKSAQHKMPIKLLAALLLGAALLAGLIWIR